MKNFKTLIAAMATAGALLYSCSPESVRPASAEDNQRPSLAGSVGDPHPALDTICYTADPMYFIREDNGSLLVDKCYGFGGFPITCNNPLPWGSLIMEEGYLNNVNYLDCNFALAPGWFCDFNNWHFGISSDFVFDNNGVPIIGTDWGTQLVNPVQNQWKLRIEVGTLPIPCFDVAVHVNALRLSLFSGSPIAGSQTSLWGQNATWNVPGSPHWSDSQFLMHFCPSRCMTAPPPPFTEDFCVTQYTGSGLGNCTDISARPGTLTGIVTYEWSTGATTQSINVCPTSNSTTYSVTISSNGIEVLINNITVNKVDATCGNGNGNNGYHKVWVCHLPPGNPENQQDICIDWDGVPAHVARFRAPGSNPNQGHDSGCEIGQCGTNPCL